MPIKKMILRFLNGSDEYNTGWELAAGSSNTYQQTIKTAGFYGEAVGGYNYVFVIEIARELEKDITTYSP